MKKRDAVHGGMLRRDTSSRPTLDSASLLLLHPTFEQNGNNFLTLQYRCFFLHRAKRDVAVLAAWY